MNKIFILLLMVLCLFGCDKTRNNARSGNRDYNRKNYKQAQEHYNKALKEDSTFKPVQYNLANTYMQDKTQDYNQAIEYYNKYLQNQPTNTPKEKKLYSQGLYNRGNAYFNLSQQNKQDTMSMKYLVQAATDYKQVMMLNPQDTDAKYNYALCLWLLKNNNNPDNNNQDNQNSSNSEINQMLEAMKNNEKNTISKVKKKEEKVKNQVNEKDW